MSSGADISTLYGEFTQALTDVLAEHAVGPVARQSGWEWQRQSEFEAGGR